MITSNKKNLIQNNESFSILLSGTYLKKNIEYNISFDPKKKTFKNFFFQYIIKMFFQYHYSKKIARVRSAARMEKIFSGRMAIGLLEKLKKVLPGVQKKPSIIPFSKGMKAGYF